MSGRPLQNIAVQNETFLTIVSGPETGTAYKLVGQTITIGRSADNNIILQDPKASRNHARIELRDDGYWIVDLGSQNGVIIDGETFRESPLKNGNTLIVGTTVLKFGMPSAPPQLTAPKAQVQPLTRGVPIPPPQSTGIRSQDPWPMAQVKKRGPDNQQKIGMAVAGLIFIVAVLMLTSNQLKKKSEFELKDDSKMQEMVETISKENEEKYTEIRTKGKDTAEYAEAQNFYLRGFREFRERNFLRAIQNFNAALAIFPAHPLARRYLERSQINLRKEATEALALAEKAFQRQQYAKALSEYETVRRLLGDPNNENYKLAEKRIQTIDLIRKSNR